MFLLSKRLNTAGVTVSPCMYIQNSAAASFSVCMLQSVSIATRLSYAVSFAHLWDAQLGLDQPLKCDKAY